MRHLILILSLLIPGFAFAISCPSNGKILKLGDAIQRVSEECGQIISSQRYTNTKIITTEWTYYLTNSFNNTNTVLKILFNYGQVKNINIKKSGELEQNVKLSDVCSKPIQVVNGMDYIKSACGIPLSQHLLKTNSTEITELKYNGILPNTLIFENGLLTGWK